MMEEQDILNEMSGDPRRLTRRLQQLMITAFAFQHGLAYLSLGFKVISTVIIVLMAGCNWILMTVKTTTEDSQHLSC